MHYPRSRKGNNRESSDVLLKENYRKINSLGFSVPLGHGLEFFFSNQVSCEQIFSPPVSVCLFIVVVVVVSVVVLYSRPNDGVHQNHCCNRRGVHYMYMHKDGSTKTSKP